MVICHIKTLVINLIHHFSLIIPSYGTYFQKRLGHLICMPNSDFERNYILRSKGGYLPYKNFGNKFNASFFPYHSKLWNLLPKKVRSSNLNDFKSLIKQEMKPSKYKHFAKGNKHTNSLLTRIRVGRSSLNEHKFVIGQTDSPECLCHSKSESTSHFFMYA